MSASTNKQTLEIEHTIFTLTKNATAQNEQPGLTSSVLASQKISKLIEPTLRTLPHQKTQHTSTSLHIEKHNL